MTDTDTLPPLTADPAQVAALAPESRQSIANTLKGRGYSAAEVDRIYGQAAAETPTQGGDVVPTYPAHQVGAHGYSAAQATRAHETLIAAMPTKLESESDEQFAARKIAHEELLQNFEKALGDEFGLELADDESTLDEQAFDAMFPAGNPSDIRIDNALVRELPNGADVARNWQEALAPIGMPAAIASQVGSDILRTQNALKSLDESALVAHWSKERELIERIAGKQGMSWDDVSKNVRAALERVPEQFRKQIVGGRGLNSASVVLQLALAGQRIGARAALAPKK